MNSTMDRTSCVGWKITMRGDYDKEIDPVRDVSLARVSGISVEGTADDFCQALEQGVDRPVVNESNLEGQFSFRLEAGADMPNDFVERLRERLHIDVTVAQRHVPMVVLKPR